MEADTCIADTPVYQAKLLELNTKHNQMDKQFSFTHKEKFRGAFWGFIVGDALGVPYEFSTRTEMKQRPATTMTGHGTYDQPAGTWSDDTSMMLCVLENMQSGWNLKRLADLFLRWKDEAYHTAHNEVFDIGSKTRKALQRYKDEGDLSTMGRSDDERDAGNGSLMRSLPYAFVDPLHVALIKMIYDSGLTHDAAICREATLLYIKMMRHLADGMDKMESFLMAGGHLRAGWRLVDDDDPSPHRSEFRRLFSRGFHLLPEDEVKSTGYVIHTLEAAIWCFLNSNSYTETVLKAVNLGEDTDTVAAVAGGLAGTFYGYDSIPEEWLQQLARRADLEQLFQGWVFRTTV